MANVGVNVPVPEVIGYMGSLYAQQIVVPQGLFDVSTLREAVGRLWIYQETAFGELDEVGVEAILDHDCRNSTRKSDFDFLVTWKNQGPEENAWVPYHEVAPLEAFDRYIR